MTAKKRERVSYTGISSRYENRVRVSRKITLMKKRKSKRRNSRVKLIV